MPAHYDGSFDAQGMIFQDGTGFMFTEGGIPGMAPVVCANLLFGGAKLQTLDVLAEDAVCRRKLRRQGVRQTEPVKPPRPGL